MHDLRLATWALSSGLALLACGGPSAPDAGTRDADVQDATPVDSGDADQRDADAVGCEGPPGLYVAGSCETLAPGVRLYEPRFPLWSDGLVKERFVFLPSSAQIDSANPDDWIFPVGTRLYKTFLDEGVRLETRLLEKHDEGEGPDAWHLRTYAWNQAQDRVTDVTDAEAEAREDVLGTEHDIPSGAQCVDCHSGPLDVANSFSAIQLNHAEAGVSLEALAAEGWLSDPVSPADAQVPGDDTAVAALGYLHSNCGNCHRPTPADSSDCRSAGSSVQYQACSSGFFTWVDVGLDEVTSAATHRTGVGQIHRYYFERDHPCRIVAGAPEESSVVYRMAHRGDRDQMPPLGTERVHAGGIDAVSAWIAALTGPACAP